VFFVLFVVYEPGRPFRICDSRRIDYTWWRPGQGSLASDDFRALSRKRGSQEVAVETNRTAEPMKRKLKLLAIVLAVLLLGFGAALFLWPCDRITAESWQKIRIGMTEEEVVEMLGGPGMSNEEFFAQYLRLKWPPFEFQLPTLEEPRRHLVTAARVWSGRRGIIFIDLDQDKHVCWKQFHGGRWINRGILDRLRDWLGW
jgi:hypothetical protein